MVLPRTFPLALFSAPIFGAVFGLALASHAASVTLPPAKDTTIYGPGNADLSNAKGTGLFAGSSGDRRVLRGLIAFDVAGRIPAGATINSVTLSFAVSTPQGTRASTVQLRRVLADWGEGTSIAPMGGGGGAPAAPGDATWNARIFNTANWTTPGGDFSPTISASQFVGGAAGGATFSSSGLVADVQAWVANPAANFGWIIIAADENAPAVRFTSREGFSPPTLLVDYTTAGPANSAPVFTTQPNSQSVAVGATVGFNVAVSGAPAPMLQWHKDNVPIAGATSPTLTLTAVAAASAGAYAVVATNAAGTATSASAQLSVITDSVGSSRLANLSVRTAMAAGQTLIVGFSVSGGSRGILMRGVGPTLAGFGVGSPMVDPRLDLFEGTTSVAQNDDWGGSSALSDAFVSVGAFPLLAGSRDAALLQTIGGTRTVHLKGTGAGVALVELYDVGAINLPRLVNVSARNQVGIGADILISGFVINGTGAKNVLIRAIGPRLIDFGVADALADPRFDVFRAGTAAAIASNDNWEASLAPTFVAVGAFELAAGSRDAALVATLLPGAYTVHVSGVNNGTGEALVEVYDVP